MAAKITVQVLNGATGEVREVIAHVVAAKSEQEAVDSMFKSARQDDHYFRFLGRNSVIVPTNNATPVTYNNQTYFARE